MAVVVVSADEYPIMYLDAGKRFKCNHETERSIDALLLYNDCSREIGKGSDLAKQKVEEIKLDRIDQDTCFNCKERCRGPAYFEGECEKKESFLALYQKCIEADAVIIITTIGKESPSFTLWRFLKYAKDLIDRNKRNPEVRWCMRVPVLLVGIIPAPTSKNRKILVQIEEMLELIWARSIDQVCITEQNKYYMIDASLGG